MDEILDLQNYSCELEKLIITLAQENLSYRKLVKRRLKKLCLMMIEMGMDPEKIISQMNKDEEDSSPKIHSVSEEENEDLNYDKNKVNNTIKDISSDTDSGVMKSSKNTLNNVIGIGIGSDLGDLNTEQGLKNIYRFIQRHRIKDKVNKGNKFNLKESKTPITQETESSRDFLNKKRR